MVTRPLEYAYPSDDLSRAFTATLTSGTQATGYEPVRLTNDNPAYPFKASSTTFRLLWDFGSAVPVKYVLLVHHNFLAGLSGVTFAMGSTTATSSFSRSFTIRTYHEDLFPQNEHLDLRDVTPTYRYASLAVTSANSVACALGKFAILTNVRTLTGNLRIAAEADESHPIVEHRTDVGVATIYSHGTRLRWLRGDKIQKVGDAAAIRSWWRATQGRSIPFVLIPHITRVPSPTPEEEESWIVRWEQPTLPRTYIGPDLLSSYHLKFEEVSRGLRPTPAAV
jgi:hypothetical protein